MRHNYMIPILLISALSVLVWGRPVTAAMRLAVETRVNGFADDVDDSDGLALLVPLTLTYTRETLTLKIRTSYLHARVNQPEEARAEVSTLTDTLLGASYTLRDLPVLLTGGMTINLPTGTEKLTDEEQRVADGEFELSRFGEGLNAGFNVSAVKTAGALMLGLNAAYTFRGEYTESTDDDQEPFDPGDQLLLAGKMNWEIVSSFTASASAAYLRSAADQVAGVDDYQNGDIIILGQTVRYAPEPFTVTLNVQQVLPQKARYREGDTLRRETENGAGNTWAAGLNVGYAFTEAVALTLTGDARFTAESPRQDAATGLPYAGRKTRYRIGSTLRYQLSPAASCQIGGTYTLTEKDPSIMREETQTITGFTIHTGISYEF